MRLESPRKPARATDTAGEEAPPTVYTIGHGTRPLKELADLLHEHGVRLLVDVRTTPRSRTNPHFNKDSLGAELPRRHGCRYEWLGKELGGLRKRNRQLAVNDGWHNDSFRGYADYMQTREFAAGLRQLLQLARAAGPACLMCAETCHWRCHRMLLSDALQAHGCRVLHLMQRGKAPLPHKLTRFAAVHGSTIAYPAGHSNEQPDGGGGEAGLGGAALGAAATQPAISAFFKHQSREERQRQETEAQQRQQEGQRKRRASDVAGGGQPGIAAFLQPRPKRGKAAEGG